MVLQPIGLPTRTLAVDTTAISASASQEIIANSVFGCRFKKNCGFREVLMATFTEDRVRNRARRSTTYRTAGAILNEATKDFRDSAVYDVFLSHSVKDAELVLGIKLILEDHGRKVYVDWLEDPQLDRSRVTPATAETLRLRMRSCLSLIYLHSDNSSSSKWMPWELGFFDGFKGAVAILPVTKQEETSFHGQEYLGIYPWIDEGSLSLDGNGLRVHRSTYDYKGWRTWMTSPQMFKKTA